MTGQRPGRPARTTTPARLPSRVADQLADRALRSAVSAGLLPPRELPDWAAFRDFRARVRREFVVPETSVTPLMARLLYGVAYLARPARMLVVGGYYGNTLVWLTGPGFGPDPAYRGEGALSVDIDATAVAGAKANFARLGADGRVECTVLDGHRTDPAAGPFDLVLLDADDPVQRKGVYLTLLDALYPLVAAGGLILAHDICVPVFATQLAPYRRAVRAPDRFAGSLSLEIDPCGLELSRTVGGSPATAPAAAGSTEIAEGGRR